jgi:hypothetical protein
MYPLDKPAMHIAIAYKAFAENILQASRQILASFCTFIHNFHAFGQHSTAPRLTQQLSSCGVPGRWTHPFPSEIDGRAPDSKSSHLFVNEVQT